MDNFSTLKLHNMRICLYASIFLFLFIWQWDGLLYGLEIGYDMGVQNMEMYTAINDQLHFGKDLVVTPYGPLGWMYKGLHASLTQGYLHTIFQAFLLNVINALLRTSIILFFWENATSHGSKLLAGIALICVFLCFPVSRSETLLNLCILLACILCAYIHISISPNEKGSRYLTSKVRLRCMVAVVSVLLALPPLVKFSYFMIAMVLIIIFGIILLVRRRYIEIGILFVTYFIATSLLWVLCGEKIQYLFSYFYAMLHFVSGYSEVMAVSFGAYEYAFRDFMFALALCTVYALMLLYLLFKNRFYAILWFISSPLLFLIFKEAFVRSDAHTMGFANNVLFVICYLLYVLQHMHADKDQLPIPVLKIGKTFWAVLLAMLLLPRISAGEWNAKNQLYADFHKLSSREKYTAAMNSIMEDAKQNPEYAALYLDITAYPDETLGMLSGEQSFFLTYDLMDRFKMDPMISLWENFTSVSESLSAEHYSGDNAPEVLLYRPEPLDGGYFPFRMGTIFQSLLENYRVAKINESGYLIMERHEKEQNAKSFEIGTPKQYVIGDSIEIPKVDNAHVFMRVDWQPTLLGQASNFILKSPANSVEITTTRGGIHHHRFFRTLAQQGIYVSNYINSSSGLAEVFAGNADDAIERIVLKGNALYFKQNFSVSFYGVPLTNEQILAKSTVTTIEANFSQEISPGVYDVFWAQDQLFTGEKMKKLSIGEGNTNLSISIPAYGWNTLRLDFPAGIGGSYDILSIVVAGEQYVLANGNDVQITQTEEGHHIVAGTYDPFIIFHPVTT